LGVFGVFWVFLFAFYVCLSLKFTAANLAPIAAASFLCNEVEQKDIAESGTEVH